MLEVLLWLSAALWTLFFLQFIANRLLIPELSRLDVPGVEPPPPVSIVVPARNEERAVRRAVESFCLQDYPDFEVVVVDDCSTDGTPRILDELSSRFPCLKVVRGTDPPPGWLGRLNALERGREKTSGEWLLFVDADVTLAPDALRKAVSYALREKAAMLFLWPHLLTGGVLEAVIASTLLHWCAAAPVFLVGRTKVKWIAGGWGAFNMVRRDALEASGAFESLKDVLVDDFHLGLRVKAAGFKVTTAFGDGLVSVRMYHGARNTIEGFAKYAYPSARRLSALIPLNVFAAFVTHLLPHIGFAWSLAHGVVSVPASLSLVLMHAVFGGVAIAFRQPWYVAFLNPLRQLCWWWVMLRSYVMFRRGGLSWRDRRYVHLTRSRR